MTKSHLILLAFSLSLVLQGCCIRRDIRAAGTAAGSFMVDSAGSFLVDRMMSHSDFEYVILAYYRRHGAWPSAMSQLRTFVVGSDGYLILPETSDHSFSDMGDHLVVQSTTGTNRMKFTVRSPQALTRKRERSPFGSLFGGGPASEATE
ncbi:MAG: hypothetical protein ACJASX_001632 [Limisphaerales bacterium]|jgi:hypothetical protein